MSENNFYICEYMGATGFSSVSAEHAESRAREALINKTDRLLDEAEGLLEREND